MNHLNADDLFILNEPDETNKKMIQTKLYKKPTDAGRYLNRNSFHPPHIFKAVPFSQFLRVAQRNSVKDNRDSDIRDLINGFINADYKREELEVILEKTKNREVGAQLLNNVNTEPIIFSFTYFKECGLLKQFIKSIQGDISKLIG